MSTAASRPQLGKVHALLKTLNVTERDQRLRVLSAVLYRQVGSTNELRRDEAHVVIDTLQTISERDDPTAYLATFIEAAERVQS